MSLSDVNWPAILIALSGALILLLRDWRIAVPALLVNYVGVAIFLAQQQFLRPDLQIGSIAVSTIKRIWTSSRWLSCAAPHAGPSASAPLSRCAWPIMSCRSGHWRWRCWL